jgi:hypothetical protein
MRQAEEGTMLYLHEIMTIVPWTEEEFWDLVETDYVSQVEQSGLRLVGLFKVGIRYNENYALWELDDWAALDRIREFHRNDPWMKTWMLESIRYRTDWVRRVMEPASFSPTLAQIKAGDNKATFYLHCLARVLPGKVDEYIKAIGDEMVPMANSWGMKLVGCYQTVAGEADSGEVIHIWTAGDANAHWGEIRQAARKDPRLEQWEAKAGVWRPEVTYRFLLGLVPFSPLHMKDELLEVMRLMRKT